MSGLGNGVAIVALPWLALELTGKATAAGLVTTATALPLVVSSLFSGTLVDLLGRRATAIGSDVLSAATVAAIPVLSTFSELSIGSWSPPCPPRSACWSWRCCHRSRCW